MSIVGAYSGTNIISLPCDTIPNVTPPSSIEWDAQEMVAAGPPSLTGQVQTYDWMTSWMEGTVSFPPMDRLSADAWSSFILQCRGQLNAFMIGDPKAKLPKGSAMGTPVVHGAGQTGYTLVTSGWAPSTNNILMTGDYIQIGVHMYKVDSANSDSSGNATLSIWPNLRDQSGDGTTIITRNCKGLFRLIANNGNKFSVSPDSYGMTALRIRECF